MTSTIPMTMGRVKGSSKMTDDKLAVKATPSAPQMA